MTFEQTLLLTDAIDDVEQALRTVSLVMTAMTVSSVDPEVTLLALMPVRSVYTAHIGLDMCRSLAISRLRLSFSPSLQLLFQSVSRGRHAGAAPIEFCRTGRDSCCC